MPKDKSFLQKFTEMLELYWTDYRQYGFGHSFMQFRKDVVYFQINKIIYRAVKRITRDKPLNKTIIIESHNDFDCNGGAIYRFLLKKGLNEKYRIVWLVKNKYHALKLPKNVVMYDIWKPSVRKNLAISSAEYLFCDDVVTRKMKAAQISVYCTHGGCTFKNVKGRINVPEHVDYILSSSKEWDPFMCENYSIPYPNDRMLHIGFPSNDAFFDMKGNNEFNKILTGNFRKHILWMPTFRIGGGTGRNDSEIELPLGIPLFENQDQLEKLNLILAQGSVLLVIKIHPMQVPETYIYLKDMSNIIILTGKRVKELDIDNYRLMASADALISDYSSATYSYLLLNRPIGFVLSDMAHYKVGFSVDNIYDYMPGEWIYTYREFVKFVNDIISGIDRYEDSRKKLLNWMYEYKDGNSCERLTDFLKIV